MPPLPPPVHAFLDFNHALGSGSALPPLADFHAILPVTISHVLALSETEEHRKI